MVQGLRGWPQLPSPAFLSGIERPIQSKKRPMCRSVQKSDVACKIVHPRYRSQSNELLQSEIGSAPSPSIAPPCCQEVIDLVGC